jgi:hypothetical protein
MSSCSVCCGLIKNSLDQWRFRGTHDRTRKDTLLLPKSRLPTGWRNGIQAENAQSLATQKTTTTYHAGSDVSFKLCQARHLAVGLGGDDGALTRHLDPAHLHTTFERRKIATKAPRGRSPDAINILAIQGVAGGHCDPPPRPAGQHRWTAKFAHRFDRRPHLDPRGQRPIDRAFVGHLPPAVALLGIQRSISKGPFPIGDFSRRRGPVILTF